jgi:hypothetical protein
VRYRPHLALIGALLCVAAFWVAGEAAGHYLILYGRHGWQPPETAFLLNFLLLGLPCALLLTLALAPAVGARLVAGFDRLATLDPGTARRVAWGVALLVGALVVGARYGLLRNTAITDDENVYDFMARLFASGRLYAPSPPPAVRAFFDNQFVVNDGRWYGIYAPGHPLVLALGQWLGAIRWTTTIEAVLTVPLAWGLARRIFGGRTALLALGLLALSPFYLLVSATMLAHPTSTLALTAFAYASVRVAAAPAVTGWWLAAGAALGWAGLTRPLTTPVFALPWLVLLAGQVRRDRGAIRGAIGLAAVALAVAGLFAAYNTLVTGHPLRTGYHVFADAYRFTFTLGSLAQVPAPLAALYELFFALARLNFWLLGWPVSLAFVALARWRPAAVALAAGSALTLGAYAALRVPSINVVGPVHYGELAVPLLLLSASGVEQAALRARAALGPSAARAVLASPLACAGVAAVFFWPVYAPSLRLMADVARAPYDLVEEFGVDNAVVFVQSLPSLEAVPGAWVYRPRNNSPDLSDRVLFVNDLGPDNARLRALLPGRRAFRMRMERGTLILSPLPDSP